MKNQFISGHLKQFPITLMCLVLGFSCSGYYAWRGRLPGNRAQENQVLGVAVRAAFEESGNRYGSRRGNCWDNAPVESFFSTLKTELIHRRRYLTAEQARADIYQYIKIFYNRKRRHSKLNYLSPLGFEDRQEQIRNEENQKQLLMNTA